MLAQTTRDDVMEALSKLKLTGMAEIYDETIASGIKRKSTFPWILHELLKSEIKTRKIKSIQTRMRIAKFPDTKDLDDFVFTGTPIVNGRVIMHQLLVHKVSGMAE
jgi:DNA replication protein DnaC